MSTAAVAWTGGLVQLPPGNLDVANWRIQLYADNDNDVVASDVQPLGVVAHVFDVSAFADGMYHAGVLGFDSAGDPAGDESMSGSFTLPVDQGTVMVHRPGVVTVTLQP